MKNIVQTTLLALALLVPTTGFTMDPGTPDAATAAPWDENDCICLGGETGQPRITLQTPDLCHTYHRDCIMPWLQAQHNTGVGGAIYTCPACSRQITDAQRTALGLEPLIFAACRNGNLAQVRALLEAGVNTDIADNDGNTLLHHVCQSYNILNHGQHIMMAALLFRHHANPNIANVAGNTPLQIAYQRATQTWNFGMAKFLLDNGAITTLAQLGPIYTWDAMRTISRNKGKIAVGACALAAAGLAYYLSPE